jgi:thiamine pyrophosphate-dependent acetolactate synthase large subunit-like protein
VAAAVGSALRAAGASHCFGIVGTANFKFTHGLVKAGIKYVAARHECNAVAMADAYSKATGELTLASVHSGPGLTNALTGIGEAAKSRTPLLVLAGDVPDGAVTSNFYFDQAQMAASVGAAYRRIGSAEAVFSDLREAASLAINERRTVVIGIPTDVQDLAAPGGSMPVSLLPGTLVSALMPSDVDPLLRRMLAAQRPLILAGRGAVISDAEKSLEALADECGALLATTVCGHGLFTGNPWSVGLCGGFSSRAAADLIHESDLIVAFGASLTQWTTKKGKLIGKDTVVAQIDVDIDRLGFQRPVDIALHGDAKSTADTLLRLLRQQGGTRPGRRTNEIRHRVDAADHHRESYRDESSAEFVDPRTITRAVDAILPADRTVAVDAGHFMGWVPRYLRVPDAAASCMSFSFQSVGLGIGSAIGLALSRSGSVSVLGTGDGGFYMSLSDLETAVRLGLRMCIIVYNDAAYGAEVHYFRRLGFDVDLAEFPPSDIAGAARGLGARAATVKGDLDLSELKRWVAEDCPGVFVLDAKICPSVEADWHSDAYAA